ncbi:MAG: hypothetical protein JRC59_04530 [Deltaproteobacteria bacterium]|nr:hypothetical protein [Deltaproteobacteria bacterium]
MSVFKKCTCCNHPWFSRDEFLEDNKLQLVGYQVNFGKLELGYFLFNHLTCLSTIAVPAGMFRDLYDGPVFSERKTDTENCPGYCGDRDILDPCDQECECAYVREIIQVVQNWPKNKDQPARVAQAL